MKLLKFLEGNEERLGVLDTSGCKIIPLEDYGIQSQDMNDIIDNYSLER